MNVEFADLGTWGGAHRLLAEFDPETRAVRIDRAAYERIRDRRGARAAQDFLAYALAHEGFHAARPGCSEEEAHAFARDRTGVERSAFEDALRP